jgi:predicted DNA-binding transcriptional regulator YafY
MGQRSRTETVAAVFCALITRRTWSQADLARAVGVRTEALRKILEELYANGVPLKSEKEHPHVYWRLSRDWYPGGVLFKQEDIPELLRQLGRLPRSKSRDRLLAIAVEQLPTKGKLRAAAPVVSKPLSEQEEQYVPLVEDAAARRVPIFMRHVTAGRGLVSDRHASVHLIDLGPPARFIATCHRTNEHRWFRVDGILHARLNEGEPFRGCTTDSVAAFRAASLDGFKGSGKSVPCSFFVREPDSKWIANNLLDGMHAETLHDGIRVSIETSAVIRLARFVVGLGGAARPEPPPELAAIVAELARGALEQAAARERENKTIPEDDATETARPSSDV